MFLKQRLLPPLRRSSQMIRNLRKPFLSYTFKRQSNAVVHTPPQTTKHTLIGSSSLVSHSCYSKKLKYMLTQDPKMAKLVR
jgi:hypothetical protein